MSLICIRRIFVLLIGLALISVAVAKDVPYLSGRVNDQAGLLSDGANIRISSILQQLEQAKGAQVAVLTILRLQDESIEKYSMRVVEVWKLGRKGVDDGVLLLVARDDRRIRIEVGYGLEGVITDLDSRRIIDNMMLPAFRDGDFEGGIEAAVKAIRDLVTGELEAIPAAGLSASGLPNGTGMVLGFFGLLLLPLVPMAVALKGDGGWTLYVFMAPFFYGLPSIFGQTIGLISVAAWLILIPLLRFIWPKGWRIDPGKGSGSVGLGRGGSSRYSGGGGFSGGGGSFGGGGASGGW